MSDDIEELCQRITELASEFGESEDAVEGLLARDDAEDLLVAVALAEAFIQNLVILETKAETHVRNSEEALIEILQEYGDLEEEEENE
jgi:hypothetical protein